MVSHCTSGSRQPVFFLKVVFLGLIRKPIPGSGFEISPQKVTKFKTAFSTVASVYCGPNTVQCVYCTMTVQKVCQYYVTIGKRESILACNLERIDASEFLSSASSRKRNVPLSVMTHCSSRPHTLAS